MSDEVCQAQGWNDDNEYMCSLREGHDGKHYDAYEGWEW